MNQPQHDNHKSKLGMPEAVARQSIMDDPTTVEIAAMLGLDTAEYAERVLDFALHPEQDVRLQVMSEEHPAFDELETEADVVRWFEDVASGKVTLVADVGVSAVEEYTTNEDASAKPLAVAGSSTTKAAPHTADLKGEVLVDADAHTAALLKSQLLDQRQNSRLVTEQRRARKRTPVER